MDTLKTVLIKERGWKCEMCRESIWMSKKIPLELHHKDGDTTNEEHRNIQILCPNCHSFTDTFSARCEIHTLK